MARLEAFLDVIGRLIGERASGGWNQPVPRRHNGLVIAGWRKIGFALALSSTAWAAPPEGFTREVLSGDFDEIIGITPLGDGRSLAYERGGLVWIMGCDGQACEEPFLDIEEEVLPHQDHGLMSVAIDPNFLENGLVYVLYVVDPHHLHTYGTPDYNPNETWTNNATIGRLVRYQALAEEGFSFVDPETRTVLIGETKTTGIPIVNLHHGLGELHFSSDGSLCFPMGDSSSFLGTDIGGSSVDGFVEEALAEGILTPEQDVGAFRCQMVDSMCGKMLRVDPATGDGLPSNPFYDSKDPRSARSRVWALGLRNVFRWEFMPGTGSDDPAVGDGRQ